MEWKIQNVNELYENILNAEKIFFLPIHQPAIKNVVKSILCVTLNKLRIGYTIWPLLNTDCAYKKLVMPENGIMISARAENLFTHFIYKIGIFSTKKKKKKRKKKVFPKKKDKAKGIIRKVNE